MKAYIIKNRGADWFGNYLDGATMTFGDESKVFVGHWFHRLKDAKKYLKTFAYPECFEIVKFSGPK
jgi:hypothetical protein